MTIKRPATITRVAVLMGGWSSERQVSLISGGAAVKALQACGWHVTPMDLPRDVPFFSKRLRDVRPDVVFNALHGRYGEDGCVQGVLDLMAIPYTHSGLLASSIAMDKPMAKKIVAAAGLKVAAEAVAPRKALAEGDPLPRPFVVKPPCDGSSVGVHIVETGDALADDGDPDEPVMVEAFIPGRELTVAVMGDRPLGVTEIMTDRGFYDYEAKYGYSGMSGSPAGRGLPPLPAARPTSWTRAICRPKSRPPPWTRP